MPSSQSLRSAAETGVRDGRVDGITCTRCVPVLAFIDLVRAALARDRELKVAFLGGDPAAAPADIRAALGSIARVVTQVGVVPSRAKYLACLGACDVVVSTALHEFFGVAFAEAMAAGCAPLAPDRLNYPALLEGFSADGTGTGAGLAADPGDFLRRLVALAEARSTLRTQESRATARRPVLHLDASQTTESLDAIAEGIVGRPVDPVMLALLPVTD